MGLRNYLAKRRFNKTPEPRGSVKAKRSKDLVFVVQEHHASRLHYDFRLELDGVLKSWAVPKGPSLNPHDRHLAVQVEDHPFSYRNFEGVIPKDNYGAGSVIVWDKGTYHPYRDDDADDAAILRKQLKAGHLTFIMNGEKLKGEFALIRMKDKGDDAWLLIKKADKFASENDITLKDKSVKSGKSVEDIGSSAHTPNLKQYPKKVSPWTVKPMLCTLVDQPFNDEAWLFEIKWDGYRAIASKHANKIALYSRTQNDFSTHYPPIVNALKQLDHDVILDGEIVVADSSGKPHFEALQNWRKDPQGTLLYYAFDILWYDGHDIRDMPLVERKQLLETIIPKSSIIRYSDHLRTRGTVLFDEMKKRDLEGIVAKQADSPYRENNRGQSWLKVKTQLRQEVVIGGFTEPRGGRKYLGSLLVGVYKGDDFMYVGHSGGGIPDSQRKLLREKLDHLERKTTAFAVEPKPNASVHWVRPELVCEMSFSEWTNDGSMRHPVYKGLRPDKKPTTVKKEGVKATKPQKEKAVKEPAFELTHLDKVFFPKHKYTKGDIIEYYDAISDYILPYLKDRPLSLLRQPNGITGESFFQKNMEHLPEWVPSVDIFSQSNNKDLHWIVGGDKDTLRYIVQLGSIEINPWNSRTKHLEKPDWIVIDLDPEGVSFKNVITVAQETKRVCDDWKIPCYPKTSGKTGIHIYIPLGAKYSYEQAKNLAHLIALEIHKRQPKLTSVDRMPVKRPHKIYLDFLQNRSGQTLAAPYSLRPTPDATVSTPLHWDEVVPSLKPTDFTIKNTSKRLSRTGDLWQPVIGKGIDLTAIVKHLS